MLETINNKLNCIKDLDKNRPRKKIAILGAGMAGLIAAFELHNLGHDVLLLEANDRVGGRAWTKRFNKTEPDKEYHELGAMRFPKEHDYTRYYVDLFGLKFRKFINHHDDDDTFYYFKGILSKHSDWDIKLIPELKLTDSELFMISHGPIPKEAKHKQLLNLIAFPLEAAIHEIKSNPDDFYALLGMKEITAKIIEFDQITLREYLQSFLKSDDALSLVGGITGLEVWWDKAFTMFLRDEIAASERIRIQEIKEEGVDEIIGGTDKLPNAIFQKLKDQGVQVLLNHEVYSINLQKGKVQVGYNDQQGTSKLEDFEHVICTLPFGVLRRLGLHGFSPEKMSAIRNMTYASSTKVLLHTKNRFWETNYQIFGGASQTDLINRQIYYPSDNVKISNEFFSKSPLKGIYSQFQYYQTEIEKEPLDKGISLDKGVLVGSYCWGQDARRLGALSKEERAKVVIDAISNIHPEIIEEEIVEDHDSIFWDEYKFASGAFCFMKPGDFTNYYHTTIKSEGGVYFAGEHCSLDNGWIQGALISSLNAVEEIVSKD